VEEGGAGEEMEALEGYPSLELLMQKTEKITKKIQTLLLSAQERNINRYKQALVWRQHGKGNIDKYHNMIYIVKRFIWQHDLYRNMIYIAT